MAANTIENPKKIDEDSILRRLEVFDPSEVRWSKDFQNIPVSERLVSSFAEGGQLIRVAKIQLEKEDFVNLEYSVHKLKTLFISIGCHKLSYLFERIFRNLSKVRIDYLRNLFEAVKAEFQSAAYVISEVFKIPREKLST